MMSTNLLHLAESYRLKGDYLNALDSFYKAIEKLEETGLENQTWVWAWSHLGETHSSLAQTLDEFNLKQEKHFNQALYCFNRAVGVKNDDQDRPLITLPEELLHSCKSAWVLAHRGETLRVHANIWRSWDKPERYEQAVRCFEQAVALDPRDAWAHAHLGATICNDRAWAPYGSLQQENYDKAMHHLDRALELEHHNYPWCLAYKGVAYLLSGAEIEALYSLLAATFQDRNIFNFATVISPPWEFDIKRSRGLRYSMATINYLLAKNRMLKTSDSEAYEHYFDAVRLSNTFWNTGTKASLAQTQKKAIQKARKEAEKIKPGEPDEDKFYILAGLLALEVGMEQPEWIESIDSALAEVDRVLYDSKDEAKTDGKGKEFNSLTEKFKELQTLFSNQLSQHMKLNEPKANDALDLLEQALQRATETGGEERADVLKAQARLDKAWYPLRNNSRLRVLTAPNPMSGKE